MSGRLLLLGALAGGFTLFAWETVSNTVIPWHDATWRAFPDSTAAVQTIRQLAPENGMYVDTRGVVAAVALRPDLAGSESRIGVVLARQLLLDVAVALLVCLAVTRLPRASTRQYAVSVAAIALAVASSAFASDWNWYGFGAAWTVVNIIDRAVGYTLLGLVIGTLVNRSRPKSTTDEWNGVRASATMPTSFDTPRRGVRT